MVREYERGLRCAVVRGLPKDHGEISVSKVRRLSEKMAEKIRFESNFLERRNQIFELRERQRKIKNRILSEIKKQKSDEAS